MPLLSNQMLQELDSSAPPLPPRLAGAASSGAASSGAASSPSPRKTSADRSSASRSHLLIQNFPSSNLALVCRHFSFPPRVSPGTQPGSITPSYSTPSASPASCRAFPPRRAGSGSSRSRRASTPASPPHYGDEGTCHQSENRVGLDTVAAGGDEGYAKRAGSSSAGNAPYWAEGSPMNRGSSIKQQEEEEKKIRGSQGQEEEWTRLANSSDQTGTSSRRYEETSSNRLGRSRSREDEGRGEEQGGGRKSRVQSVSRHRSGPVTRWKDKTSFKKPSREHPSLCQSFM